MNLSEIENLSAADLKAKRAELSAALKAEPPDDLAERYVQARTDAKLRDDKLGEQGKTISLLQAALDKASQDNVDLVSSVRISEAQVKDLEAQIEQLKSAASAYKATADVTLAERGATISTLTAERDAARALAKARRVALATIAGTINPLLADEG